MNLIPKKQIFDTGNYFCTWGTQGEWYPSDAPQDGCVRQRDGINQRYLFAPDGALHTFPQELRGDLLVVLDDGWDVPYGTHNPRDGHIFGSVCPDAARFSLFGDTPGQRLFGIGKTVRECGFAGFGLWISPQFPRKGNTFMPIDRFRAHFEQAAQRCNAADVRYFKIDWGWDSHEFLYRAVLGEAVRKYAPRVLLEQTSVVDPLAVLPGEKNEPAYQKRLNTIYDLLPVSDYFRTYDVMEPLAYVSTLMRLRVLFERPGGYAPSSFRHIPNVEHLAPIAAVLGCSMGLMHHPLKTPQRAAEIARALHFQRLAPPFGLDRCQNLCSEETQSDAWFFPQDATEWPYYGQTTRQQTAPICFARNTALPVCRADAEGGLLPYAAAALHPDTGVFSVGTFPRTVGGKEQQPVRAQISVCGAHADRPCGIFGFYRSLRIAFDRSIEGRRVFAQDLASDSAREITHAVTISGDTLFLDGALLEKIGTAENKEEDRSAPALILVLAD